MDILEGKNILRISSNNVIKLSEYFESKMSMTGMDLRLALGMMRLNRHYDEIPLILHQLRGPWIKHRITHQSKLLLLANRFSKSSNLSKLPVDVARLIAKRCVEIKVEYIKNPLLKLDDDERELLREMQQKKM